jgi:hypothetical protein
MKFNGRRKANLNITIDVILFLLLGLIAGIGFLLKYTLIHGSERNVIYGNDIDLLFLGMDRHEWGIVHFVLSIIFIGFLVLHIIFHWKMIICMLQSLFVLKKIRYFFVAFLIFAFMVSFIFPFIVRPEIVERETLFRNSKQDKTKCQNTQGLLEETDEIHNDSELHQHHHIEDFHQFEINGQMNLQVVSDRYEVPLDILPKEMGVPISERETKLGRLKRNYNFTMSDVGKAINKIKNQ